MAVCYNDSLVIKNTAAGAGAITDALLSRNTWGTSWRGGGYGWLPYPCVLNGLTTDWWSLISKEYVATGKLG